MRRAFALTALVAATSLFALSTATDTPVANTDKATATVTTNPGNSGNKSGNSGNNNNNSNNYDNTQAVSGAIQTDPTTYVNPNTYNNYNSNPNTYDDAYNNKPVYTMAAQDETEWYNGEKQYQALAGQADETAWYNGEKQYQADKTLFWGLDDHHHDDSHKKHHDDEDYYYEPKHASKYEADEYYGTEKKHGKKGGEYGGKKWEGKGEYEPEYGYEAEYESYESGYDKPAKKGKGGGMGKGKGKGWTEKGHDSYDSYAPKKNLRKGDYNKL